MSLEKAFLEKKTLVPPDSLRSWLGQPVRNYVGGEWVTEAERFETLHPATNETLAEVSVTSKATLDRAVSSARAAFEKGEWAKKDVQERCEVLRRLGDLVMENRATLALLESLDTGKPISESYEGDIPRAASNFHFFASAAAQEPEKLYRSQGYAHLGIREPLGVTALITPWNLPLYLETWKIAPALAMGNSVILKPSELTPLTAAYFCELVAAANVPDGVFHCLQGFGEKAVGEWLVSHPEIDAISFTGETSTGRAIMRSASSQLAKVSFELGGKGAALIFDDADLDAAVATSIRASFRNQGQICLALPRIFVQRKVYSEFLTKFIEQAKKIKVGNPLDFETTMGALISKEHLAKVESYVTPLSSSQIVLGGKRPELPAPWRNGNYLSPTIAIDVEASHVLNKEEVFGPVVSVIPFDDTDAAVREVNATPYGLSASLWTRDLPRATQVAKNIRAGMVWVNQWFVRDLRVPFGGQKDSGLGREGGEQSLNFFSEWKSLCLPL